MVRITILYPNEPGKRFDLDYYVTRHLPLVRRLLGPMGLTAVAVDRGVTGLAPAGPPRYTVTATLAFPSVESVQAGLAAHGDEILGDIPNYTDIQPYLQIGEVVE